MLLVFAVAFVTIEFAGTEIFTLLFLNLFRHNHSATHKTYAIAILQLCRWALELGYGATHTDIAVADDDKQLLSHFNPPTASRTISSRVERTARRYGNQGDMVTGTKGRANSAILL